jgi:hypothetical protein
MAQQGARHDAILSGGMRQQVSTTPSWTETQPKVGPGIIHFGATFDFFSAFIGFAMTTHRAVLST